MKTLLRRPVADGTFYPADPARLEADVRALLAATPGRHAEAERPFAIVVPHAGYRYSGPVAASAYGALTGCWADVRRIALFGPSHFEPLAGLAVSGAGGWRTPIGDIEVDDELRDLAIETGVLVDELPHLREHALEVQLPWLQVVCGADVRIVPVAVGRTTPAEAGRMMGALADVADLVLVSTDLSHYLPVERARIRDRHTANAVLMRDPHAIGPDDACGLFALRGIVELARRRDLRIELLDLRTSADTAGDPDRVVGYGAFRVG